MKKTPEKGSRRSFLKQSVTGLAGMAMLPTLIHKDAHSQTASEEKRGKIITRKLGTTGIELPIVSLGAGSVRDPQLIHASLDKGIVHLDTAHSYSQGQNEEMIGEVVKDRPRDSFVVATKATGPEDRKTGLYTKESTSQLFLDKFETSLKRLGLEYVDILYMHSIVRKESVVYEPFLSAMLKLKKEGKTRFIGVSTHSNEPEVIRAAVEAKVYDVVLTAYNFQQPHVAELDKEIEAAAKAGLGIVAMKTQAGVYWDRERQKQINMKAALKWVLQNKNIHTSIPGITTLEQLDLDMSVMEELSLTPEEKKDLQLGQKLGLQGLYCRQCRSCVSQCHAQIEIPTLMRSYMYVYGYGNLAAAKEAVKSLDLSNVPCETCRECTVTCTMGFDVRSKVRDIARIRNVPDDFIA